MKNKIVMFAFLSILLVITLGVSGCSEKSSLRPFGSMQLSSVLNNNIIKVQKVKGGPILTLKLMDAIIEDKGTPKEKKCLCQAGAFRVAQLASQVWKDGVFRSYEIEKIRTGWNSDGPYEFFSDRIFHGEPGDMGISAKKILIVGTDGGEATSTMTLTSRDFWYKITFINGKKIFIRGIGGEQGMYLKAFFAWRTKKKLGKLKDEKAKKMFLKLRKQAIKNITKCPFDKMIVNKGTMR